MVTKFKMENVEISYTENHYFRFLIVYLKFPNIRVFIKSIEVFFQFILRHETVFVQINICVNNCIEVIDASVLSSDNSQLKLTTIGHRTGPYSLSELLRLACTLNPRRQFVPLLCDSCLIIKKINCIIASCFVFFLSSHAYNVTLGN